MKLYYGDVPIKAMNLGTDTDDATLVASDLQSGVTAYARGQKITGTGKTFSFASYGAGRTNFPYVVPKIINAIQIGSTQYPTRMTVLMEDMVSHDFSNEQQMAEITVDGIVYPMTVSVKNNILTVSCNQNLNIELFFGKDEYI